MAAATRAIDNAARAARVSEVSDASWGTGLNFGGGCNVGIGINAGGGAIVGTPEQFTLLDQNDDGRTPQQTQSIGGTALNDGSATGFSNILVSEPSANGDGGVETGSVNATLTTLSGGWNTVAGFSVTVEAPEAKKSKSKK